MASPCNHQLTRDAPELIVELRIHADGPIHSQVSWDFMDELRGNFSSLSHSAPTNRFFLSVPPCISWVVRRRARRLLGKYGFHPNQLEVNFLGVSNGDPFQFFGWGLDDE